MKKVISVICLFAIFATVLCSCAGNTCEHCGESTLAYNQVGDSVDGIRVCNACIEKMTMGKLDFNFTCDGCGEEKVGKENEITVEGEAKIVCNTCNKHFEENGSLPE